MTYLIKIGGFPPFHVYGGEAYAIQFGSIYSPKRILKRTLSEAERAALWVVAGFYLEGRWRSARPFIHYSSL